MFRRVSVLFCRFACSVSMSVFHCSICLVMYVSPICCSHAFTASVPSRVTLSICCSVSSLVTVSMLFILFVLRPAFSVFMSYSLVSSSVSVCGCVHCNLCSSGLACSFHVFHTHPPLDRSPCVVVCAVSVRASVYCTLQCPYMIFCFCMTVSVFAPRAPRRLPSSARQRHERQ